jgi:hypothetical protein
MSAMPAMEVELLSLSAALEIEGSGVFGAIATFLQRST